MTNMGNYKFDKNGEIYLDTFHPGVTVEQIKENLKGIIRDLNGVIDTVKLAEKERKSSEKEIEAVRSKLRQIQSVAI